MAGADLAFGFVNAFKPPGPSSTSFGAWVRRVLGCDAAGHWGTLDPGACGVLVLAVGVATRLLPLLTDSRKQYVFELVVGARTSTGDATGDVVERARPPASWDDLLRAAAAELVGDVEMRVPAYAAVKVGGRPLYAAARKGAVVDRPIRRSTIYALEVLAANERSARLLVECAAGTYIRSLCEAIGEKIGAPAHMGALLRTAAGSFSLSTALTPAEIAARGAACLIDPLEVLPQPKVEIDRAQRARFLHGNDVLAAASSVKNGSEVLVIDRGHLLGTAIVSLCEGCVRLAPSRVLVSPTSG